MKQVFLKFLLVFFVVSQLIVMPMQTAFANELEALSDAQTEENSTPNAAENPASGTSEQKEGSQIINQPAEGQGNEPTAQIEAPKQETVQQVEVQEQVRVPQAAAMRAPQQVNVTTTTTINKDNELVNDGDELKVKIDWAVPSGVKVQAGDYFYIPVSSNLAMFNGTTINLDDKGSCIVEGTQVKCTLSEFVNDKDNVKGFIGFGAKLNSGLTPGQGEQSTQITVNGETITLTVDTGDGQVSGGPRDVLIEKFGVRDTTDPTKITWTIFLNEKRSTELGQIYLNDIIGEGHIVDEKSISISVDNGSGTTYIKSPNEEKQHYLYSHYVKGLTLEDNRIQGWFEVSGTELVLTYSTKITNTNLDKWENRASIQTENNQQDEKYSFVEQYTEGGAQGDLAKHNGKFTVTKVNEAGEALAGATFTFTNGTQTYTLTTDANGKASTGEIPGGIYTLTETTAPAGYTIAEEYATGKEITVNFKDNKTVEQTVENKAIVVPEEPKGAIEIVKKQQAEEVTSQLEDGAAMTLQTATEKTLAGAEFTVTNAAGEVVATLTTGEDGTAKADNLPVGTYTVKETKAPTGYVLDATPFTVEVTADKVVTKTVYNKLAKPQFTCPNFTVTVKGNGLNKDVVRPNITVTAEKDGKQIEFGVTNKDGQVTIDRSKLEVGIYTFTAKDNEGNKVSEQLITITNEDCAAELNLATDKCERFEITILKDKQPVPNKKYVVVKDNVSLELTTDENGKMYIPNTEEGTYTLIDAEDEEQFKEITVSFDGNCGTTLELPLVPVIKGCERFEVTVKENGKVVANTEYQLQQNGNVITTVTTDDNGKFSVDRDTVTIGDYELVKDGKKVADIKVEYDKCEFEVDTTVENTCPKFEITVNENSKAVANATYTATNGESVLTITTDDNGKFVIDRTKVVTGKYVVTQGEKVVGEFTVTEADCEAVVDVTPKYSCEKYEVIVVTEGDNTVRPGLDVTLQGEKELKGTTDKDGKVSFDRENVPAGDYKVIVDGKEIKTITIVDEDCKVTIELPKVEEPTTPVDPEKPTTPEKPVTPVDPEKPTTPEKPVTPVDPEKPTTPEKPVTPVDPEKPEAPKCENFTVKVTGDNKAKAKVELVNGKTVIAGETNENGEFVVDRDVVISGKYEVIVNGEKQEVITVTEEDCEATITIKVTEQPQPEAPKCENFTVKVTGKGNADAKIKLVQGKTVIEGKTNKDGEFVVDRDVVISGKYEVTVNGKKQEAITVTEEDCEATITLKKRPSGGGGGDRPDPKPEKPSVEVPNENPKPGKPEPKPEEPTAPETKPEEPTTPTEPETKPEEPTTPENPSVEIPNENPNTEKPQPEQPTVEVPNENPNTENEQAKPELPTVQQPNTDNKVEQPTISVPAKELPKAGNDTAVEKLPQTDGESTLGLMLTGFALIAASIFLFTRRKQMQ